jgi:hypothetical protein
VPSLLCLVHYIGLPEIGLGRKHLKFVCIWTGGGKPNEYLAL